MPGMRGDQTLFEHLRKQREGESAPLAARMRPRTLDEFAGQEHLLGPGHILERAIRGDQIPSMVLWGPPGVGKTTLARLIAGLTKSHFIALSAVTSGVADLRKAVEEAREIRGTNDQGTILFIDEVHRFNKSQQDAILPHVENGTVVFIGATTENPSFEVIAPLLSRTRMLKLEPLNDEQITGVLDRALADTERGLGNDHLELDSGALEFLLAVASGDARVALNAVELAAQVVAPDADGIRRVDKEMIAEVLQRRAPAYDKAGDSLYDTISAFIKSVRASDPDAAVYWLARMLEAGEDPLFIARRIVISASEDVGMADPQALPIAVAAQQAVHFLGLPEGTIPLAEATVYLATAPKSNASYMALNKARVPLLMGVSCASAAPTATPAPQPTSTATPTATPTPLPPTPTPAPTPTPRPLKAADIFALVSPSIAFVETSFSLGTGVLVQGGYVLTAAHVVWPAESVRLTFPNGQEIADAPVAGWDMLADIAVIGPLQAQASPIELVGREDIAIGTDVFLIGYPEESGAAFPQPTITRGLVSRLREWDQASITYFQTDAAISGGQSGGVIVSSDGEVFGMTLLRFTDAGFGIAASAADLESRVQALIRQETPEGVGSRRLPTGSPVRQDSFSFDDLWETTTYVVDQPEGTTVEVTVGSEKDAGLFLASPTFEVVLVDDTFTGAERGTMTTQVVGPHFVTVRQYTDGFGTFDLSSNHELVRFSDPDDQKEIPWPAGESGYTVIGSIDYPGDWDFFRIDLEQGQLIDILADSPNVDLELVVEFPGLRRDQEVYDDDSGGGMFGTNPMVTYLAPHTGQFVIAIGNVGAQEVGGYFLSVTEALPGSEPTAIVPEAEIRSTPFGDMVLHRVAELDATLQIPADWTEIDAGEGITAFDGPAAVIGFTETVEDLRGLDLTFEQVVDRTISSLSERGFEAASSEPGPIADGKPSQIIELTAFGGQVTTVLLLYLRETSLLSADYTFETSSDHTWRSLVTYSLHTLKVDRGSRSP